MLEESELPQAGSPLDWTRAISGTLERVVAVLLTVTIVVVAAGSAWRPDVKADVNNLRWLILLALCAASLALAWRSASSAAVTTLERRGAALVSVLIGVCLVSSTWSVLPKLTLERGLTVTLVLVTSAAIAFSAARLSGFAAACVRAILAAIAVLLLASLVLAVVDTGAALQRGIVRFRGVQENPDTLPLLAAYGLPLCAWLVLESGRRWERRGGAAMLAAIVLLLGASGSRGGILAGAVGLLVVVWFLRRSVAFALTAAAGVLVVLAGSLAVTPLLVHLPGAAPTYIPTATAAAAPTTKTGPATTPTKTAPTAPARYTPAELRLFAEDPTATTNELGRPLLPGQPPQRRNLFTSSGRVEAWLGAIHQGNQRPLLGYGFGTEDRVFVDRWYSFDGARPENTFIGTYLQLGVIGVLAVCALLGWAVLAGARALVSLPPARRRLVAAVAGVVAAGLTEMLVQSFATSAGDIAMLSFWVCLGLFATSSEWAES